MVERFLGDRIELHCGDCRDVLARLPENSLDACVTDPPYHLQSIVKRFAKNGRTDKTRTTSGPHQRIARGFMNKLWDGGDIAFRARTWRRVHRVLKPGAWLVAFAGTRTHHRIASAIEQAGFVVYDMIAWTYGQGFPKSHDIARAFETTLCERCGDEWLYLDDGALMQEVPPFRHPEANQWAGWGTALKPALEPICLARKPLSENTIAANVRRWGTGGLNIDGCRIGDETRTYDLKGGENLNRLVRATGADAEDARGLGAYGVGAKQVNIGKVTVTGYWPANIVHDGNAEVLAMFSDTAGRFFYTAKADADDRLGSGHPAIKPLDLMQWLIRLVTPPSGIVLDPFAGTGTTGEAAWREGMRAVLIEAEPEYQVDIRRRMQLALSGPDERARAAIKAKIKSRGIVVDDGPLFAAREAAE